MPKLPNCHTTSEKGDVVKPYYESRGVQLFQGDCRKVMAGLPAQHFQCCVTSPPYFRTPQLFACRPPGQGA